VGWIVLKRRLEFVLKDICSVDIVGYIKFRKCFTDLKYDSFGRKSFSFTMKSWITWKVHDEIEKMQDFLFLRECKRAKKCLERCHEFCLKEICSVNFWGYANFSKCIEYLKYDCFREKSFALWSKVWITRKVCDRIEKNASFFQS
jgi:hypothetical protein